MKLSILEELPSLQEFIILTVILVSSTHEPGLGDQEGTNHSQ